MSKENTKLAFGKKNFQLMFATIGVIILGLVIMSLDNEEFGFGFLGLTLGPLVLFIGFMMGFVAILANPQSKKKS